MSAVTRRADGSSMSMTDPTVTIGRLTLLVALVNSRHSGPATVVVGAAMLFLFLEDRRIKSAPPWLVLASILGALAAIEWWRLENHDIATVLWIGAFGLSRLGTQPQLVARTSARLLLGLIFAFAFAWKLLSSQYMSNDFFRYTLVWDERFEVVADHAGGTDLDALRQKRAALVGLTTAPTAPRSALELPEGPHNSEVAWTFTAVGLVLEGVIAVAYLTPIGRRFSALRYGSVFLFCATTYAAMPVVGFGLLLLTLLAAATSSATVRRAAVWASAGLALWGFAFVTFVL